MRIWANESAAAVFSLPPSPRAAPRALSPDLSGPGPDPPGLKGKAERCGGGARLRSAVQRSASAVRPSGIYSFTPGVRVMEDGTRRGI